MTQKTGAPNTNASGFELNNTEFPPIVGSSFKQHSRLVRDIIKPQVR